MQFIMNYIMHITGNFVINAQKEFIKDGFSIAHYNMRFVKPLDFKLLHKIFSSFENIITCIYFVVGSI